MATEIAINTVSAQQSIKGLDSALGSAVNSMKAGIAQASSVGDSLGAMQAKVSGLDQVMTQLQSKIDVLKDKQSDLDVKTKEGAESYLKLQKQIEQSENRLASYSAQQDRAKESMTYYSSGLAELQRGYQTTIEKTDAYSNRLKAEGDELGANKAKLSGYKEALANLNSQYDKQAAELKNNESKVKELSASYSTAKSKLDEMTSAGQKNSNEYKDQENKVNDLKLALNRANESLDTQKIRIDKTGTSIAETKTKTNELSEAVGKEAPQGFFKSMMNGFKKTSDQSDETKSKVGGMMSFFAGGALLNGVTAVTSKLQEQVKAGYDDAKAAETFSDKFKNMGASTKEIDLLGTSIKQIKENSNLSGGAVTALTQKFYGMSGNVKQTQDLTKGVGSLSDALHLSQQQSDAFAGGLNKIESSGKVTSLSLGRLEKQAPGLSSVMAKSAGMSKKAFQDLVGSGKMTAKQFNDMLTKAGGNFDTNAKKFNSTTDGATHHMQTAWADTRKALMKPLVQVSSTGLSELTKVLDSKETQNAATQLGSAIGHIANASAQVIKVISGSMGNILSIIGSLTKIVGLLASGVWDTFSGIGKDIANVFESIFGKSKKAFDPLKLVAGALQEIGKHQNMVKAVGAAIGGIVAPILAVKGAMMAWNAAIQIVQGAQKALNVVMNANPFGIVILAITAVTAGLIELYNHSKTARDIMNAIGKTTKDVFNSLVKGAGSAIGNITKTFGQFFSGIGKLLGQATKAFGSFIGGVVNLFKNNWKQIGLFILNPFAGISAMLYKNVKPFRDFVNTVRDVIFKGFGAIGNFFGSFWNGVKNVFNTSLGFITKNWSSGWNSLKNIVTSIFGGISNFFGGVWNGIKNLFSSSLNFVAKIWSAEWNGISNVGKSIWNGINGFLGGFWNGIKSMFNSSLNFILNIWNNVWNTVANVGKGIWNGITNFLGGFWNGIKNTFTSALNVVTNVWGSSWTTVSNVGKGIWNGITNVFNGFVGGIKNIWNDVTSFVGRMWSDMWNGVINAAKSAVSTVGHVVAEIANGVIRPIDSMLGKLKDGINWILDKVGAHKIDGFHIPLVSYANGTKDTHQGGLAIVNDAPGSNFREMYQLPNGQVGMFPNKRNMIIPLPKGTSVLDGERSASMAKMMGLPAYKNGIGDFFGGLWNGAKDIFSDVENILKNPAKFMESTFSHFLGGFSSNIKLASSIITSFPKKLAAESINWVKKQFESMEAPAGSGPAGSGAARWRPYIVRAFKQLGVAPADWKVAKLLRQIQTESGGNPRIMQQIHDVNSGGNESRGLLQFSGSTWAADALPGHTDWKNGYDEILAAIHVLERGGEGGWGGVGNGHGWENGGFLNHHQMIEVGEHNMNEVVIPLDSSKRSRTTELMHQVLDMLAGNSDVNLDTKFNSKQDDKVAALINEVSELKDTVKDLVNLQIETIKAQNGTTNAVINTAQTPQDRYKQDAQNGQLLGYQQLNGGIA
ncbi:tape measure domain protein [Fructilactobacillus lindneri DSM 20690 = JCM 11027]|uniref:Tape measure domain protein n=2 Tax=Fructilactobacillus lindneri TaxID=53444 RepID=A0A0R2K271_9LACO|nr:tape measure domain protein [Fructilactobacillus lindneri DSM 20690 = JCM 11027]